jgi:DNA-binding CsgD family transcriptional regulator
MAECFGERMKIPASSASLATEPTPQVSSDIDTLANEIFARLNGENRSGAVEDLQLCLARAASTLARPTGATEGLARAALQELPPSQLDVLLLHLSGLTCAQIAHRQAKTYRSVLTDLTSAYVRLRLSMEPMERA